MCIRDSVNLVDYAGVQNDMDYPVFIDSLASANLTALTKNETYALFMNAYNALAIKMVIDHPCRHSAGGACDGPVASIKDIGDGPNATVWNKPAGTIGGKVYSLQQIEDYLRAPSPFSEDARLHACIVCASISCPNVRMQAYTPERIDVQMSANLEDMLSNRLKGMSLDKATYTVTLSNLSLIHISEPTRPY
eukprot:TRINITY_DN2346_c0_g1_i4.p1 TRINITY_DN2346_c0_g1~~TRINITY_DN2346_c0_g1_i4.p1  ORF type:complete len:192 (+),score=38.11 TRINITY_DN2346_c0_g1_i4:100-675(+)